MTVAEGLTADETIMIAEVEAEVTTTAITTMAVVEATIIEAEEEVMIIIEIDGNSIFKLTKWHHLK
jgi:hypothetical protein